MIPLFKIYKPAIDYKNFNHNLHGQLVTEFEQAFSSYMGVKYAIGVNSCTSAIYLVMKWCQGHYKTCHSASVPTMIPPVVLNSLYHSDTDICFVDDTQWVGSHYYLKKDSVFAVIDSAHEVDSSFIEGYNSAVKHRIRPENRWCALYSFYPTKPVSGIDGGVIITNNESLNNWLRIAIMNGTTTGDSWKRRVDFPGWKYYMSTGQAYVAYQQFARLEHKKKKLNKIREKYNDKLGYENSSDHLYRIIVRDNDEFMKKMLENEIQCGIHYRCTHNEPAYKGYAINCDGMKKSEHAEVHTVSIPFHEDLTVKETNYIIKKVKKCQQ